MDFKKYGFSKQDPDYWLRTSGAIWSDGGLSTDEKMQAQLDLVQIYQKEKREKKEIQTGQDIGNDENIKNLLGLSQSEDESRVKRELIRLKDKSKATWQALGLHKIGKTKEEILRDYGVE